VVYLKEELKWNYIAGFAMMVGAVFVIFKEWWGGREQPVHSSCARNARPRKALVRRAQWRI